MLRALPRARPGPARGGLLLLRELGQDGQEEGQDREHQAVQVHRGDPHQHREAAGVLSRYSYFIIFLHIKLNVIDTERPDVLENTIRLVSL